MVNGRIISVLCQKLLMRSLLDDLSVIQDKDLVGIADGGDAISNDKRRTAVIDIIKLLLNIALCLHIHRRGGIVKHKDRRILQKCSRQRNTLLLSTGQTNAALTDDGIIAVRKLLNKQISICHLATSLTRSKLQSG